MDRDGDLRLSPEHAHRAAYLARPVALHALGPAPADLSRQEHRSGRGFERCPPATIRLLQRGAAVGDLDRDLRRMSDHAGLRLFLRHPGFPFTGDYDRDLRFIDRTNRSDMRSAG